jgi:hypothetical protein
MTTLPRRSFLLGAGGGAAGVLAFSGSLAAVLGTQAGAASRATGSRVPGYGPLVPDPAGLLDLPAGFRYVAFSRVGTDLLDDGTPVPGSHDGMAAFAGPGGRTLLVRNHEISPEDVEEDGAAPVPHVDGHTYDPQGTGGTTTLVVDRDRRLESHAVSLAGTSSNCAGGPTPWGTWLTCEETDEVIDGVLHGYVFEVDPVAGGDPRPLTGLGRFEHEAVSLDQAGTVYLTEDADSPFGQIYRFRPDSPGRRGGGLRDGGRLETLRIPDLAGTDLSAVADAGTVFTGLEWLPVATPDAPEGEKLRELYPGTPIPKAEGTWAGGGSIWFVSSHAFGPDAEDEEGPQRRGPRRPDLALPPPPGPAAAGGPLRAGRRLRGARQHHGVAPRVRGDVHRRRGRPPVPGRNHPHGRHLPRGPEPHEQRGVRRRHLRPGRPDPVRQRPGPGHHLRHLGPVVT